MALGLAIASCDAPPRFPPISTETPAPLAARIETRQAQPIEDRWLLLPVALQKEGAKRPGGFSWFSHGVTYQSSAWSDFGALGGGGYHLGMLNLEVVDLRLHRRDRVFDRQVALGGYAQSWSEAALHFEKTLILVARTTDTNADRQIDERDEIQAFTYDLENRRRTQISPAGHSVEDIDVVGGRIILTLRSMQDSGPVAVFAYDPRNERGEFVVDTITP